MPDSIKKPQPGDVIFHESKSAQAGAIKEITNSRYTHCGIVVKRGEKLYVAEAINPVRVIATPDYPLNTVEQWVARGVDAHAVLKRLIGGVSQERMALLEVEMLKFNQLGYDGLFQWNDKKVYCSEFIHDSYQRALGITLGRVETFGDFNMDGPLAKELIKKRYTEQGIPFSLSEQIITPISVMVDPQLETVATVQHGQVQ
jgi:hypothetical protein